MPHAGFYFELRYVARRPLEWFLFFPTGCSDLLSGRVLPPLSFSSSTDTDVFYRHCPAAPRQILNPFFCKPRKSRRAAKCVKYVHCTCLLAWGRTCGGWVMTNRYETVSVSCQTEEPASWARFPKSRAGGKNEALLRRRLWWRGGKVLLCLTPVATTCCWNPKIVNAIAQLFVFTGGGVLWVSNSINLLSITQDFDSVPDRPDRDRLIRHQDSQVFGKWCFSVIFNNNRLTVKTLRNFKTRHVVPPDKIWLCPNATKNVICGFTWPLCFASSTHTLFVANRPDSGFSASFDLWFWELSWQTTAINGPVRFCKSTIFFACWKYHLLNLQAKLDAPKALNESPTPRFGFFPVFLSPVMVYCLFGVSAISHSVHLYLLLDGRSLI